ncbi:ADP-ribosylation factor family-domain-containing protein [Blastocladiella britannica]|nr:ADP-ribosylation factor family-domain-containing protein [Blastocladiella britannica]
MFPIKRKCTVVGLDGAGKSTLVRRLVYGLDDSVNSHTNERLPPPPPTVGFQAHPHTRIHANVRLKLAIMDMSGNPTTRHLWFMYIPASDAVIVVVDATDRTRIEIVRRELAEIMRTSSVVNGQPVLVLCNKMDGCDPMSPVEIATLVGMESFKDRNWFMCGCSAEIGHGVSEGLMWLEGVLDE